MLLQVPFQTLQVLDNVLRSIQPASERLDEAARARLDAANDAAAKNELGSFLRHTALRNVRVF